MDGIVNFLKPAGMSSHDAVYFLRRVTGEHHIGHTGTLDPMAAGVLPMAFGVSTRFIEYMENAGKGYRAGFRLNQATDTGDVWGELIATEMKPFPSRESLEKALEPLRGRIQQVPPAYSAIKVDGVKLYKLAREGQKLPEIPERTVIVRRLELLNYNETTGEGILDIHCSKGTYVRSLISEMGRGAGTCAVMTSLVRTQSGPFLLEDTVSVEELNDTCHIWAENLENGKQYLHYELKPEQFAPYCKPADFGLNDLGVFLLRPERLRWVTNGGYLIRRDGLSITEPIPPEEPPIHRQNHVREKDSSTIYKVVTPDHLFCGTVYWSPEKEQFLPDKILPNPIRTGENEASF